MTGTTTHSSLTVGMVTFDCEHPRALVEFWQRALRAEPELETHDFVILGGRPSLGFQRVEQPTLGMDRVHLDLSGGDRTHEPNDHPSSSA